MEDKYLNKNRKKPENFIELIGILTKAPIAAKVEPELGATRYMTMCPGRLFGDYGCDNYRSLHDHIYCPEIDTVVSKCWEEFLSEIMVKIKVEIFDEAKPLSDPYFYDVKEVQMFIMEIHDEGKDWQCLDSRIKAPENMTDVDIDELFR